jgi:peptide-methionine (S)-S-oxide reductase
MASVNMILFAVFIMMNLSSNHFSSNVFEQINGTKMNEENKYKVATFGEGCFWCTEAVFQRLNGVIKVESGYSGGTVPNPTYEAVCTGKTGHAEVSQITFDPSVISFKELLYVFFKTHDPTTLNRQGADVGT